MDSTHLHLLLNHFPIIGSILGTGIMGYGYIVHSSATKKAALLTWVAMAIIAIPVFLTGEPAEERVENMAGVSEAIIGQHEDAAQLALWLMEALGLLSLAAMLLTIIGDRGNRIFLAIIFVLSLFTFASMAYTGYLGGQIRHTEIRSGSAGQSPAENGSTKDDD